MQYGYTVTLHDSIDTYQHVDWVVAEVLAGLDESTFVLRPVSFQEGILHEQKGPPDSRQKPGHIFHYSLSALNEMRIQHFW